jgi:phosphomethylpyrimidine synthase
MAVADRIPSATTRVTTEPLPASRKVYVEGSDPSIRVPMREIAQTPTREAGTGTATPNPPILVYDSSGPYTDPLAAIDVRRGLPALRQPWILGRGDVAPLEHPAVASPDSTLRTRGWRPCASPHRRGRCGRSRDAA